MTLHELKIASYLMQVFSDEEKSYKKIALKEFNLNRGEDSKLLLKFLNEWGCRQFKIENHNDAAKALKKWYINMHLVLPKHTSCLISQGRKKIKEFIYMFDSLKDSYASTEIRGFTKTVGPVGAAKTLFALRKNMFPPWDNPIIDKLGFSRNGEGYTDYLLCVKDELLKLKQECHKYNIDIRQLPKILNRSHVSLVKFIDEYYWLTITSKCDPSEIIKLSRSRN